MNDTPSICTTLASGSSIGLILVFSLISDVESKSVAVTTPGTGYTYAYIRVADINSAGGGSLSGSELDVIIEPKGGHGKNAITELGGFFVMMNTNFEADETANSGDFTTANDFRRVCLMRDPKSGGSAASATTLRGTKAILVTSPSGNYTVDEEINQATTGAVGKVVEWDSSNNILWMPSLPYRKKSYRQKCNRTYTQILTIHQN